jgi:hypothetical protein
MWPVISLQSSQMLASELYPDLDECRPPSHMGVNIYQPIERRIQHATPRARSLIFSKQPAHQW